MSETSENYLYNQFREIYQFTGVPINLYLKGKEKKERPSTRPEQKEEQVLNEEEEAEDWFEQEEESSS